MFARLTRRLYLPGLLLLGTVACGDDSATPERDAGGLDTSDGSTHHHTDASDHQHDAGQDEADAGGQGSSVDGDTFTSLFEDVFSQMQLGSGAGCGSFYCHATGTTVAMMTGLALTDKQGAYDLLVNADASSECDGWKRVVPYKPEESLLLQKLVDPPCGERMPKDGDALPEATIERVRAWILNGAKND